MNEQLVEAGAKIANTLVDKVGDIIDDHLKAKDNIELEKVKGENAQKMAKLKNDREIKLTQLGIEETEVKGKNELNKIKAEGKIKIEETKLENERQKNELLIIKKICQ